MKLSNECIRVNNNTSSKSKNILLLVLSQAINLIILFLFTPYLVRALPQEQFGTYSQVLLIAEFIGVLVSLAVVQIAMMVFTKPDVPFSDAFKTVFRFNLISSLLGVVFMWLFSTFASSVFRNESLTFLLILFSPYVLGLKMNAVFNQALIRLNESKFILYVTVSMNLLKLTLAFVAVHYYHSLPAMMVVYALDPVLQSTIQYIKIYLLGHTKGHFSMKLFKDLIPIALPLYLVELFGASYAYISGFVISININENAYAIYKNGSFEIPVISSIYSTISMVFMGDLSKMVFERDYLTLALTKKKIISTTALLVFPVAIYFMFFSREFILFYYSAKYAATIPVFIIFTGAMFIRIQNYTDVLVLIGNSKLVLLSFFVFMVSNIVLNILLSSWFGVVGCALATIVSVYLLAGLQLHFTIRKLQVNWSDYIDLKKLFQIVLLSILVILPVRLMFHYFEGPYWLNLMLSFCLSMSVYVFVAFKTRIAEIAVFQPFLERIPYFGTRIYNLLR